MKPLYKFKKNKQKKENIILPPSSILQNKDSSPGWGWGEEDTLPTSGCTLLYISEGPLSPQPQDESVVGGQPAGVRQRQKTALIALISKDNKTISVLLAKRFRTWGFSCHQFPPRLYMLTLTARGNKDRRQKFSTVSTINSSPFSIPLNSPILLYSS